MALLTDTNLVGAWGLTRSTTSPWWVNTTFSGLSLVINGTGQPVPLVVGTPTFRGGATATGIAFNGGTNFLVAPNEPARFIFATLNGTISAWSPNQANTREAVMKVDSEGIAAYTGLTLAQNGGKDYLYVANFLQKRIDVFDSAFHRLPRVATAFADSSVPRNLTVFNVQALGGSLYVTYAPTNVFTGGTGPSQGFVTVYDVKGRVLRRLQRSYWMNAPWGVALAPANFGQLSRRVLVGMFGSGAIAGFDAQTGAFKGFLSNTDQLPLIVSKGLWGLGFGNGANAGPTNTLYFASDFVFGGQAHGFFGSLTAVPSPQAHALQEDAEPEPQDREE
jgi:uncharacterized protein (TIGR03118 family)